MIERSQKRKKKRLKVRFGTDYPKKVAFTGDASEGGLYIITGQPERPGTKLLIELILPNEEQVIVYGRVRWAKKVPPNLIRLANKAGMGVQLTQFETGKQAFSRYLDTLRR
ncbi:PilZ domain-containing protein [Desulfuromusa kysingii]|uniref:PilZ domain-containing protein n=1 Tax=Desulfuromusa kysingii TaxID=37625 RepID=A0A1H4DYW4_9BACT|nr:PilZ domain-containing protein [Desulfuromusa kysingii]SEA77973.1 PilZ domain-containing protein [Desulfuromusa kysingii]